MIALHGGSAMQKPMILLTPRAVNPNGKNRIYYDNESYFTFIRNNGGIPVLSGTVDAPSSFRIYRYSKEHRRQITGRAFRKQARMEE